MNLERTYRGNYIQGSFVPVSDANAEVQSTNPGNLGLPAIAFPVSYEHVNEAVMAAQHSFSSWKRMPAPDRCAAVKKYRDLLASRIEDLATLLTFETGKPLWESYSEVKETLSLIDYYIQKGSQTTLEENLEERGTQGVVRFLPRGVIVSVSASNQPLYVSHSHLIPAIINGNTAVLKSSKRAPVCGQRIAETIHDSGFPSGVINVLQGNTEVSRRLIRHEGVSGVFFTGPFEKGIQVRKDTASHYWKTVVLELSGKNSTVIWEDCDYRSALHESLLSAYITAGQRRTTTHQILVHQPLFDRFVSDFHALAKQCKIGYGFEEGAKAVFMGPLDSEKTLENYLRYQGIAVREGCEEIMRGKPLERAQRGYYVSPSIHVVPKGNAKSVYQKDEFFGPNVALFCVEDTEQAADWINQSQYGLVTSIYAKQPETFRELLQEVQVGTCHWNAPTTTASYFLPTCGINKSGNGRPMGAYAQFQCTYSLSSIEKTSTELPLPESMPVLK